MNIEEKNVDDGSAADPQRKVLDYLASSGVKHHASIVMSDLRTMDFKNEIVPIDSSNLKLLKTDFVFWAVSLIAIIPLFLVTLSETQSQITGFCLFFASIWGLAFKKFILAEDEGWLIPIASLFFTGIVGINVLLWVYEHLPRWYNEMPDTENPFGMILGSILHTGITEELCKIIPVLLYITWKRQNVKALTIVLVGVFSGLGFAAFENMDYAGRQVLQSARLTVTYGAIGLQEGVQSAMVNVMLRSMSAVFGHAVYSGIFSYFIALAFITGKRRGALAIVGLLLAATIHGLYNSFWAIQTTIPALITAAAFMLFYAYLTKLRLIIVTKSTELDQEQWAAKASDSPASIGA
jgi:RsiW-degrading membrane proteinase PrsW (M82 family)